MSLLTDQLKDENLTLEQKLAAIDKLMDSGEAQKIFNMKNGRPIDAPVNPSDLTICDGCE